MVNEFVAQVRKQECTVCIQIMLMFVAQVRKQECTVCIQIMLMFVAQNWL